MQPLDCQYRPLTLAGVSRGARDLAGALPAIVTLGVGFGAAASSVGLSPFAALAMSGLVFAGASQFAALELWAHPLPLFSLALLVLAVNARHIVLSATLFPLLGREPHVRRLAVLALLSDANWAATQEAARRGEHDLGHLVGGGLAIWTSWICGTALGVWLGGDAGSLHWLGVDAIMPIFFSCTVIGMYRGRTDLPPWGVAAAVSGAAVLAAPPHWAILIGTAAGILTGGLRRDG